MREEMNDEKVEWKMEWIKIKKNERRDNWKGTRKMNEKWNE